MSHIEQWVVAGSFFFGMILFIQCVETRLDRIIELLEAMRK